MALEVVVGIVVLICAMRPITFDAVLLGVSCFCARSSSIFFLARSIARTLDAGAMERTNEEEEK